MNGLRGFGSGLALLGCTMALAACDPVEEIRERLEPRRTPHEAYAEALRSAGLAGTALGREWTAAAARALETPVTVRPPYRETGYLAPEQPGAVGYRVGVRRGQRVAIAVQLEGDTAARVFLDVFQAPADTLGVASRVASADSGSHVLEFEPRRDGEYVIRLQPELLRGGRYTLEIRNGPALSFPVERAGNRNIQSVFGDARDGGRRNHHGIDIFAPRGTPVLAATAAVVTRVRETPRGGKVVWLRDERRNASLYYAHLDRQLVEEGMRVRPGDTLGLIGNTGNARSTPPHLHFGMYQRSEGPIDPMPFVRQLPSTPPRLTVDATRIGDWTRTRGEAVNVRAAAFVDSPVVAALPQHTPLRVAAGAGDWYRVMLPDGRMGFIAGNLVEEADRPLRREVLTSGKPVQREPSAAAIAIDSLAAGEPVAVLGRFGEYLYVQAGARRAGWLTLD